MGKGRSEETEKQPLLNSGVVSDPGDKVPCSFISARYAMVWLASFGFFNIYALRVNLSVALVAMVNNTAPINSSESDECPNDNTGNSSTTMDQGEFNWDEDTQGLILGAFFYGYITTQLPGGWLSERIGGKRLFGLGVLCTSALTLLTPLAARAGVPYFVALRVLEGVGEGVTFPSMHTMLASWAPVYERTKLAALAYAGSQIGTVFANPISGILCQHGFAGGWPSVFYVFGALGCLWFVLWMLLVYDSPAQHPRITEAEKRFILNSIGERKRMATPWRHILTSSALWGTAAGHFAGTWGFYSMLTCLPMYMKKILHFDIQKNGILSGVPYLVNWFAQLLSGWMADFLRERHYLSTAATRKLMNTIGSWIPAALLVAATYTGCDHTLAVVLLSLGVGSGGFNSSGYGVNHLDIAPMFAGTLLGITNAIATIPGFLSPQIVGLLTNNNETTGQWRIFFFITAGIYFIGSMLFIILAQGEEQWWAKPAPSLTSAVTQEYTVTAPGPAPAVVSGCMTQGQHVSVQNVAVTDVRDLSPRDGGCKTRINPGEI